MRKSTFPHVSDVVPGVLFELYVNLTRGHIKTFVKYVHGVVIIFIPLYCCRYGIRNKDEVTFIKRLKER